MVKICPRCKGIPEKTDRFCGRCGYNLTVPIQSDFVTKRDFSGQDIRKGLAELLEQKGKHQESKRILNKG